MVLVTVEIVNLTRSRVKVVGSVLEPHQREILQYRAPSDFYRVRHELDQLAAQGLISYRVEGLSDSDAVDSQSGEVPPFVHVEYEQPKPTYDFNPPVSGALWVQGRSGDTWVCLDNTSDDNIWAHVESRSLVFKPTPAPRGYIPGKPVRALWKLEGSGKNEIQYYPQYDAVPVGTLWWTRGRRGGVRPFPAPYDPKEKNRFNLNPNAFTSLVSSALTLTAWIKLLDHNATFSILQLGGRNGGLALGLLQGRPVIVGRRGSYWHYGFHWDRVPVGEWTFIAGVYQPNSGGLCRFQALYAREDDTEVRVWPPGGTGQFLQVTIDTSSPDSCLGHTYDFCLCNLPVWGNSLAWRPQACRAVLDEVRIYQGALTEEELSYVLRDENMPSGGEGEGV